MRPGWRRSAPASLLLLPLLLLPLVPTFAAAQGEPSPGESVRELLERARSLASQGDVEGAASALGRAISLAPSSEDVLNAWARFSLGSDRPIQAILALEPLTRMLPGEAEYAYLLGVARMQVGEMADAATALEQAAALDPGRVLTQVALGLALNREKRFEEAHAALVRALRLAPDDVEALAAMSEAAEGLGRPEQALDLAERALGANPDHPTALVTLGMVRLKEGRLEEARSALARSVSVEEDFIKGHYQLGLALARLGDLEGAERHRQLSRQAQTTVDEQIRRLRSQRSLESELVP